MGAAFRLRRIDASRLCRIAFTFRFCIAYSYLWRPPASPAAHRPLGGGASRVLLGVVAAVALGVFFELWSFVNALNCVSYGEPDVRPAGRPDGRVRGLALRVGGILCVLFRVGYTGHWPVRRARGLARCGGGIRCGLFRAGYTGRDCRSGRVRGPARCGGSIRCGLFRVG